MLLCLSGRFHTCHEFVLSEAFRLANLSLRLLAVKVSENSRSLVDLCDLPVAR